MLGGYPLRIARRLHLVGDAEHTRIVFVGDSTLSSVKGLSKRVGKEDPDAIVFSGDMANERPREPLPRHLRRWRRNWGDLADRVYAIPGNHDYGSSGGLDNWWDHAASRMGPGAEWFEHRAFLLSLPSVTVLGLDCGPSGRSVDDSQLAWMTAQMKGTPTPWRIIVLHAPLASVSLHLNDPMPNATREKVEALAADIGAQLLICGHEHLYARTGEIGGTIRAQVIAGGGGAALYPVIRPGLKAAASRHHHVVVDVAPGALTGRAIASDGDCLDAWEWSL